MSTSRASCFLRRAVSLLALASVALFGAPARAVDLAAAEAAIRELDVQRATQLLAGTRGPETSYLRALLAVYSADCDAAVAQLSSPALRAPDNAAHVYAVAKGCAGATAGALVINDEKHGVWLRLQDESDQVLVPLIVDGAARARDAIERDLGVTLPRPLRIDVVRDLFSLSAVSGLPLEAAETTGTVAVARWGRITLVSPRAMQRGYSWQDTLAHEITHLLLARGSRDEAPLWLQEGIAKREETRWRPPRPFDREPDPDKVAYDALVQGKAVGIDQLGPSIAMLPSPEAASIAFAEVVSFMGYWIEKNGPAALPLLLADLKVTGDAERAMKSVSGYGLTDWKLRWQADLRTRFAGTESLWPLGPLQEAGGVAPKDVARWLRLGELLSNAGKSKALLGLLEPDLERASQVAPLRWQLARAAWLDGRKDGPALLGGFEQIDAVHGAWVALRGHWALTELLPPAAEVDAAPGSAMARRLERRTPEELWEQAVAIDPLLVDVACEGYPKELPVPSQAPPLPSDAARRALCEHVRKLPARGSE